MFELPEDFSICKDPATDHEEKLFFQRISTFSEKDNSQFPKYLILKVFHIIENNFYLEEHIFLKETIRKQISQILKIDNTLELYLFSKIQKILKTASHFFIQKMFDTVFCFERVTGIGISTFYKINLFEYLNKSYSCFHRELILSFFRFGKDFFSTKKNYTLMTDVKFIIFNELSHIHFKNVTLEEVFNALGTKTAYRCIYEKENYIKYISKYAKSEELLDCVKKPILYGHESIYWNVKMHLFPVNKKRKTKYGTTMTLMLALKRLEKQKRICKNDPALFEFMFESLNGVDLTHFLLN